MHKVLDRFLITTASLLLFFFLVPYTVSAEGLSPIDGTFFPAHLAVDFVVGEMIARPRNDGIAPLAVVACLAHIQAVRALPPPVPCHHDVHRILPPGGVARYLKALDRHGVPPALISK